MQLRHALTATSAGIVLGLAACGGGDSAEEDIRSVAKRSVLSKDVKVKCEEVSTKGFIKRVYGDVAQCRRAERTPDLIDEPPTEVRVSNVKVDGDQATATVIYEGGDTPGATGTFEFRKEDDEWRIDDLGVDFLRSQAQKGLESDEQEVAALQDENVRACARKAFAKLSDDQVKRVAYAAIAERPGSQGEVSRVFAPCILPGSGTGSQTGLLREQFVRGITSRLRRGGVSQADIDCIERRLRSSISATEILQSGTGDAQAARDLTRKGTRVIRACRGR